MTQQQPACLASTPGLQVGEHLKSLLDAQRQATAHLLGDLRYLVLQRSNVVLATEAKDIERRVRQIERALEFYRRAETRVEILMARFRRREACELRSRIITKSQSGVPR